MTDTQPASCRHIWEAHIDTQISMGMGRLMGEMHCQIEDVPKLCEAEELVFIFDHLLANLPAHRVGLWLKEPDSETLQLACNRSSKGWVSYDAPIQLAVTEGIVGSVFREHKAKADVGLYRSKEASPQIDQKIHQHTGYQVSVPFMVGEECLGVLSAVQLLNESLANPRSWGFPAECITLMTGFSGIIALLWAQRRQA